MARNCISISTTIQRSFRASWMTILWLTVTLCCVYTYLYYFIYLSEINIAVLYCNPTTRPGDKSRLLCCSQTQRQRFFFSLCKLALRGFFIFLAAVRRCRPGTFVSCDQGSGHPKLKLFATQKVNFVFSEKYYGKSPTGLYVDNFNCKFSPVRITNAPKLKSKA